MTGIPFYYDLASKHKAELTMTIKLIGCTKLGKRQKKGFYTRNTRAGIID